MKKATLHVYPECDELISSMADFFVKIANESIAKRQEFVVALAGGSSPAALYRLLASPAYNMKIDWGKVYFFFGDERYVPITDAESNAFMAKKTLFDPLQIPASNIFMVDTTQTPELAAEAYNKELEEHFHSKPVVFDLIILGLGEDAHTASLFPNTAILQETQAKVKSVFVDKKNTFRISFTAPLINDARHVAFFVYGKNKAKAVRNVLVDDPDPEQFPAQLIQTERGEVHWFMEEEAASQIAG